MQSPLLFSAHCLGKLLEGIIFHISNFVGIMGHNFCIWVKRKAISCKLDCSLQVYNDRGIIFRQYYKFPQKRANNS